MSETKHHRTAKRQLGQFMTPIALARSVVEQLEVTKETRVLEPSFGDGSFIIALIEKLLPLYEGSIVDRMHAILTNNIYGVEIDPLLYETCLSKIEEKWGYMPAAHNLIRGDFLCHEFSTSGQHGDTLRQKIIFGTRLTFDIIVGNPPFGGTINLAYQDALEKAYGFRNGNKIKKETYSFFLVKSLEHLSVNGRLIFICSDTFMTIQTMRGLRKLLMEECSVSVRGLKAFSEETSYPMVLLELVRSGRSDSALINGQVIERRKMELTGNFSWKINEEYAEFFFGPKLGDYVVCSSGMTIGKNELFVRKIVNGELIEPYDFEFFDEPISVRKELSKARLQKMSVKVLEKISSQESSGATRRNVRVVPKATPVRLRLPHSDYLFYNKATRGIIYSAPTHVIFWKDQGDAVLTFKKNGNWYLHGVGGRSFFGRSGLTWQLVAQRLNVRYLPEGYILDSGSPCAFLHEGVDENELFFILGWTCTELATTLLKTVINHTMNIQGKDFERLPYPYWVGPAEKEEAIHAVRRLVQKSISGDMIGRDDPEVLELEKLYSYREVEPHRHLAVATQLALW